MDLSKYPQKIKYTTNLDYPKSFYLVLLPERRGSKPPDTRTLEPLEVGEYVSLPIRLDENLLGSITYKVDSISGNHTELSVVYSRCGEVEEE